MKLTKAQQNKIVAALEKAMSFNPEVTPRAKAFGVVVNATINSKPLKELAGDQDACAIAGRVLDKLGYSRSTKVTVKL